MVRDVRDRLVEDHRLDDGVHVETIGERLADTLVRERHTRDVRLRVPTDEGVPEAWVLGDLHRVDGLHVGEVARGDGAERDLTGLQARRDRGGVRDDLVHVLVEVRGAVPVVRILLEDDLVTLAPLAERERSIHDLRVRVLRRVVDVLRLGGRGEVLAEHVGRQDAVGVRDVEQRGARDLRHRDGELLRVRRVDLDALDRLRLAVLVVVEALDVLIRRLANGLGRLPDGLHAGQVVLGDDRLAVRPVRLRVDLEGVGQAVLRHGERREVRLGLTGLCIDLDEHVVQQSGHAAGSGVVHEDRLHGRDVRDRGLDDTTAVLRLFARGRARAGGWFLAGRWSALTAGRRDEDARGENCHQSTSGACLGHGHPPLLSPDT